MSENDRTANSGELATWRLASALEQHDLAAALDAVQDGADPDANFAGERPLHIAIERGYLPLVRSLLAHGADPNAPRRFYLLTPLHDAAAAGSVAAAQLLIDAGADLEARTSGGWTPLHVAVDANDLRMVLVLLDRGADITATNREGETLLHIVKQVDHHLFRVLVDHFDDLNARDAYGVTPLGYAAAYGRTKIVEILLSAGADRRLRDRDGRSPADWARQEGHPTLADRIDRYQRPPVLDQAARAELHDTMAVAALDLLSPHLEAYIRAGDDGQVSSEDAVVEITRACELFERMIDLHPLNWNALWGAGMGYKMLGQAEQAYHAFRNAYAIQPEAVEVGRQLVLACLAVGRAGEAVMVAAELSSKHPDDAGLLANLGLALLRAGRVDDAAATVKRALEMDQDDVITRRLWKLVRSVQEGAKSAPN